MTQWRNTIQWLKARAQNITALLLFSMFVTFLLQIVFRYVLKWSVGWTIEWVAISWLWGILFGYAFVVRPEDEIRLDIVYSAVPPRWKHIFDIFTGLVSALIFAYTLPASWAFIEFMAREKTAYMKWPFNLVFSVYIPFAIVVVIRGLMLAYRGFKGITGKPVDAGTHDYD